MSDSLSASPYVVVVWRDVEVIPMIVPLFLCPRGCTGFLVWHILGGTYMLRPEYRYKNSFAGS